MARTAEETKALHEQRFLEWREKFPAIVDRGIYYGYPKCCINDVCFRKWNGIRISPLQRLVSGKTAFIPCVEHAQQIADLEIEISSLITDRKCKHQFPTDDDDMLPS